MKQVTLNLPDEVVLAAQQAAQREARNDGLKNTPSRVLRDWIIIGGRLTMKLGSKENHDQA